MPVETSAVTPGQALALQRLVGNAAVVQLEAAQGSVDAEADASRSAVHDALRSPGRPLGGSLLAEMEARFGGADFSQVRLHTGASARRSAAELGARAYTTDNHIVAGDSALDKETVAHELRHVEQQRSGPVPGTNQGGVSLSDPSDAAERDAEATARQVMSGPAPFGPTPEPSGPASGSRGRPDPTPASPVGAGEASAAGPAAVQRRPVAQVEPAANLGAGEPIVRAITITERPDSPHPGGTEGEHTTAMVVLEQAVRTAVVGKDARAAGKAVWELYQQARSLPGAALVERLPTGEDGRHRRMIEAAQAEVDRLGVELGGGDDVRWDMTKLQRMISEYLQFRGLLPLSTMNRKVTGTGDFGKGKGESVPHQKMLSFEQHEPGRIGKLLGQVDLGRGDPQKAIRGLMDRLVITEYGLEMSDEMLQQVAPGTDPARSPDERVEDVVRQHVESIVAAYPKAFLTAWDSADDAVASLTEYLADKRKKLRQKNIEHKKNKITELRGLHARDEHGNRPNDGTIQAYVDELALYNEKPPPDEDKSYGRGQRRTGGPAKKPESTNPRGLFTPIKFSGKSTADADSTGSFAVNLDVDDGGVITGMTTGGRPASPFSGTEGAHTTAWTVHLDSMKQMLVGRGLKAAVEQVPDLVRYAQEMQQRLAPVTKGKESLDVQMSKLSLNSASKAKIAMADSELRQAGDLAKTAAENDNPDAHLLALQRVVRAVLARVNLIPGVAYDQASTAGRGEGTHRQTLLTADASTSQTALQDAIFGLLDLPSDISDQALLAVLENHIALIKNAYPDEFNRSGIPEDPEAVLKLLNARGKRKTGASAGDDGTFAPGRA